MCTEQCAVIDVNSKSLRNMSVPAYKARQMGQVWKVSEPEGVGGVWRGSEGAPEGVGECRRGAVLLALGPSIGPCLASAISPNTGP